MLTRLEILLQRNWRGEGGELEMDLLVLSTYDPRKGDSCEAYFDSYHWGRRGVTSIRRSSGG